MPDDTIEIVFRGVTRDGLPLTPETIAVSELLALLAPLERAIQETAGIAGRALSLLACRPGSSSNVLAVSPTHHSAALAVHRGIQCGNLSELPQRAQQTLSRYWKLLHRRGVRTDLVLPDGGLATIDASRPLAGPAQPVLLRERRALYGKVVNAGGVDASKFIHLAVLHQRTPHRVLPATADEALVKEVAARMFEVVHLAGEATFDVANRWIVAFRADRLLPYRPTPLTSAFEQLRRAAGGEFDGVDPLEYQRALRGGGAG